MSLRICYAMCNLNRSIDYCLLVRSQILNNQWSTNEFQSHEFEVYKSYAAVYLGITSRIFPYILYTENQYHHPITTVRLVHSNKKTNVYFTVYYHLWSLVIHHTDKLKTLAIENRQLISITASDINLNLLNTLHRSLDKMTKCHDKL